jgi:hypothetical protein
MLLPTVGHICRDTDPLTQGACGHIHVVPTLEEKGDGEGGRDGGEREEGTKEGGGRRGQSGWEERTEWMEGRRGQSGWKGGEDRVDGREGMIVRE